MESFEETALTFGEEWRITGSILKMQWYFDKAIMGINKLKSFGMKKNYGNMNSIFIIILIQLLLFNLSFFK